MRIPIACSLTQQAAGAQLDEWRALLSDAAVLAERPAPTEVRFRLRDGAPVAALVDLARREKACCPFFDFSLLVEADALTLRVAVPDEGAALLDGFVAPTP
ncbi:MAG: hypothetical protein ACYCU7_05920 [Acidimicrobiales bacterium]